MTQEWKITYVVDEETGKRAVQTMNNTAAFLSFIKSYHGRLHYIKIETRLITDWTEEQLDELEQSASAKAGKSNQ